MGEVRHQLEEEEDFKLIHSGREVHESTYGEASYPCRDLQAYRVLVQV